MKTYSLNQVADITLGKKGTFLRDMQQIHYLLIKLQDDFKNIRKKHGLTQKQMADKLNVSVRTIHNLENRLEKFSIDRILDIANEMDKKGLIRK